MRFHLIGVNHTTAPVEVRERLAIPESRLPEACKRLSEHHSVAEGMIVSTCNRVEFIANMKNGMKLSGIFFASHRVSIQWLWESLKSWVRSRRLMPPLEQ
jgi:glutamyl-tRNA reductase